MELLGEFDYDPVAERRTLLQQPVIDTRSDAELCVLERVKQPESMGGLAQVVVVRHHKRRSDCLSQLFDREVGMKEIEIVKLVEY